jgi:putative SOS response-associated peptidase YedK
MCNLYSEKVSYRQLVDEFSQLKLPVVLPGPEAAPNLEPLEQVRPTDVAPVIRAAEGGVELARLKWGFAPARRNPPSGASRGAPPVINFRSEGRRFGRGRCLVPADGFFEFTGSIYPKTRWRFTEAGQDWLCMAGLWRPAEGDWPESFTLLTAAPGPDVKPYHDRQVIVLPRERWTAWLDPEVEAAPLLVPGPAGSLQVEQVAASQRTLL